MNLEVLMCGICGYVSKDKIKNNDTIVTMVETLTPRNTNNNGVYIRSNVALGHTQLDIRNIDGEKQPMTIEYNNRKYTIVYNGKIYNIEEITKKLTERGYVFKTPLESEAVLASYILFGEKALNILDGIFAFAILNEHKKKLFLARDPLGIKPLFYTLNNRYFLFCI